MSIPDLILTYVVVLLAALTAVGGLFGNAPPALRAHADRGSDFSAVAAAASLHG